MKKILNDEAWLVKGFWPYVPLLGSSVETKEALMGIISWLDSKIPGSVYGDLRRGSIIEEPHKDMNSIKCEWYLIDGGRIRSVLTLTRGCKEIM